VSRLKWTHLPASEDGYPCNFWTAPLLDATIWESGAGYQWAIGGKGGSTDDLHTAKHECELAALEVGCEVVAALAYLAEGECMKDHDACKTPCPKRLVGDLRTALRPPPDSTRPAGEREP
jgi:hypothetical protein